MTYHCGYHCWGYSDVADVTPAVMPTNTNQSKRTTVTLTSTPVNMPTLIQTYGHLQSRATFELSNEANGVNFSKFQTRVRSYGIHTLRPTLSA